MDQDDNIPPQHEDSNFNLYDAYAVDMDDSVAAATSAGVVFPLGGWDHHDHPMDEVGYPDANVQPTRYDPSTTTTMDAFSTAHYEHGFQPGQAFEQGAQQFQDFMAQADQQTVTGGYDLNAMDLYHAASIYPNIAQEAGGFDTQSPMPVPETKPNNPIPSAAPSNAGASNASTTGTVRQMFKFTPEQKQIMTDKFNAGLHYPTNAEKEALSEMFGASSESISRWFERTRKEKGVQRTRKPIETPTTKPPEMPQYLPIQPNLPQNGQQTSNIFSAYGQFPSTYPYNTLNPQFFEQVNLANIQPNISTQPTTVNPSAGMYAPIPFVGSQSLYPGMQNVITFKSDGLHDSSRVAVEIKKELGNRAGSYSDDTRSAKRPKIDEKPIQGTTKEIAPKPLEPKKPMTFEEELLSILRPSEWRDYPVQAAADLLELMGDAEDDDSQKLFLLRNIWTGATEIALRTISNEDNRRILAKIRNWFTAALKTNDTSLLSVIVEVIKKLNLDVRTMAAIKFGKPLIVLMKKEEPSLKAQLMPLQKTAYEAYALEKDGGPKLCNFFVSKLIARLKADSPVATSNVAPPTTASTTPASTAAATKPPPRVTVSTDKTSSGSVNKAKAVNKPSGSGSGSSFFGRLAQTPTIPKTPVLAKPIPLKKSTTPSQSMAVTTGGAVKPPATTAKPVPPKPTTTVQPKPAATSKFSVLEYISRGDSSDNATKAENSDVSNLPTSKKRKHVSWAADDELEHVKMIENITINYAEDLFWHPPQAFGNARDLDIGEGRAFGKDTVEYDVEEEIEWYEPKLFDFPELEEGREDRGAKRAGNKAAEGKEAEIQKVREAGVLLVTYVNDGDIPESPTEPFLEELVTSQQTKPPKVIPLPQELKTQTGANNGSVAGQAAPATIANPDVTAILSSLLGSGQPTYQAPAPVSNPDLASILQSLSGQPPPPPVPAPAANIASNIDLTALLSQFQTQGAPQQQWTAQSTSTRSRWDERPREAERDQRSTKKRDVGSRIKASRLDDVRESVRNSNADQNMYRALCSFYKTGGCRVGDTCTFVHPRDMTLYDQ